MVELEELVGTTLANRYHVEAILGFGGMGAVYRARHAHTQHPVALKVVVPRADEPALLPRFFREARLTARLRHPNIVQVYDFGRWGPKRNRYYMAMELVDGLPLAQLLDVGLHTGVSCTLISQVLQALAHVHAREVLHRDVKPDNILVERGADGRLVAKLGDFGIAAALRGDDAERLTQRGAFLGTPAFVAPEQVRDAPMLGPPVDIYSVGVILYRMLTGRLPFEGSSAAMAYAKIDEDAPAPRARSGLNIAPGLALKVLKMIARLPEERYALAAEASDALVPFCEPAVLREDLWRRAGGLIPALDDTRPARAPVPPPGLRKPDAAARQHLLWDREEEMRRLGAMAAEVEGGRVKVLLVTGEDGTGKSALLKHLAVELNESGRFSMLRAACRGQRGIVRALAGAVDRMLGTAGRSKPAVRSAVEELLRRHREDDETEADELVGFLRPELGGASDGSRLQSSQFAVLFRLLRRLARIRPVLLTVDDIAMCCAEAGAFLDFLLFEVAYEPFPLMVVATYRVESPDAEFSASLRQLRRADDEDLERLHLGVLNEDALAKALVRAEGLAEPTARRVARRAGGNPMYALHLARAALAETDEPTSVVDSGTFAALPQTLHDILEASLAARLQRTPDQRSSRIVLAHLAVLGEEAPVELLADLLDGAVERLDDVLDALIGAGVLLEVGGGTAVAFAHAVFRDVLGTTLGPRKLRRAHRRAAELRQQMPRVGQTAIIAGHYLAAGDVDEAVGWMLSAQWEEAAVGNSGRSAQLGSEALQLLPAEDPRRLECGLLVGKTLRAAARLGDAEAALKPLLGCDDVDLGLRAGEILAEIYQERVEPEAWKRTVNGMEDRLEGAGEVGRLAYLRARAFLLNASGRSREALPLGEEAVALAAPGEESVLALARMAWAHLAAGDTAAALEAVQRALSEAGDQPYLLGEGLRLRALVHSERGEVESMLRSVDEGLELQRRAGRQARIATMQNDAGLGLAMSGDTEGARERAGQARMVARELGLSMEIMRSELVLAVSEMMEERFIPAWVRLGTLCREVEAAGNVGFLPLLNLASGLAAAGAGRIEPALEALERSDVLVRLPLARPGAVLMETLTDILNRHAERTGDSRAVEGALRASELAAAQRRKLEI
jgi:tetratricopeptide (TPR) repeat protein